MLVGPAHDRESVPPAPDHQGGPSARGREVVQLDPDMVGGDALALRAGACSATSRALEHPLRLDVFAAIQRYPKPQGKLQRVGDSSVPQLPIVPRGFVQMPDQVGMPDTRRHRRTVTTRRFGPMGYDAPRIESVAWPIAARDPFVYRRVRQLQYRVPAPGCTTANQRFRAPSRSRAQSHSPACAISRSTSGSDASPSGAAVPPAPIPPTSSTVVWPSPPGIRSHGGPADRPQLRLGPAAYLRSPAYRGRRRA